MPPRVDPSDRRLLLATAAVLVVLIAAVAFVAPPPGQQGSGIPSVFSTSPDGARAAYVLLQELERDMQAWERPPTELPELAANTVLILANPEQAIADARARAERLARLSKVELGPIVAVRETSVPGDRMMGNPDDELPRKRLEMGKFQEIPVRVELLVRFDVHTKTAGKGQNGAQ